MSVEYPLNLALDFTRTFAEQYDLTVIRTNSRYIVAGDKSPEKFTF